MKLMGGSSTRRPPPPALPPPRPVIVVVVDYLIYCFLEITYPRDRIDVCKPWPAVGLKENGFAGEDGGGSERFGTVRLNSSRPWETGEELGEEG